MAWMLWPWQLLLTKGMVVAMMGSEDDLSAACWVWDARSYSKGRFPFQIISKLIAILSAVQGKKKKKTKPGGTYRGKGFPN